MIDRQHDLSITKQAEALGISRSSVYYSPRPVPAAELAVMRRMDELHLEFPFAGSRMLRDLLNRDGTAIGRRRVSTLMKRMGIEAIYRKPNTSKPAPGHKIYAYLLRGMKVDRPNQVWAMDITYVPMARGFVYLAAVVDWFSRRVLSWRVSIILEAAFCVGSVRARASKYNLCSQTGGDVPSRGFHDGQHGHGAAEELESAAIGGHMLMVTEAGAEEVAQFVVSATEPAG